MTGNAASALGWFQASAAPVAVVDASGVLGACTATFAATVGAAARRLDGVDLLAVVAPHDRTRATAAIGAVAGVDPVGQPVPEPVEIVVAGCVAGQRPFRCSWTLGPVPGGGEVVIVSTRLSPPMGSAPTAEPVDRSTETDEIAGALSHDVRASLRSVNGFLGLVERSAAIQDDDSARKHLRTSRDAGTAADNGVEALVRLMRIRERPLAVRSVALDAVIDKGVQRTLEVLPGPAPTIGRPNERFLVLGDPLLIGELLGELFTNARKFGGDSVRLHVGCTQTERWLHLTVADDGPGIPPALADDAFRLFRLLQPKGRFPGVGMGLPLARAIAESHAGTISIEHRDGAGAVVHLYLPAGTDDA